MTIICQTIFARLYNHYIWLGSNERHGVDYVDLSHLWRIVIFIYFIFIVILNLLSWAHVSKDFFSFLCFVYWWIIKSHLIIWFSRSTLYDCQCQCQCRLVQRSLCPCRRHMLVAVLGEDNGDLWGEGCERDGGAVGLGTVGKLWNCGETDPVKEMRRPVGD